MGTQKANFFTRPRSSVRMVGIVLKGRSYFVASLWMVGRRSLSMAAEITAMILTVHLVFLGFEWHWSEVVFPSFMLL